MKHFGNILYVLEFLKLYVSYKLGKGALYRDSFKQEYLGTITSMNQISHFNIYCRPIFRQIIKTYNVFMHYIIR